MRRKKTTSTNHITSARSEINKIKPKTTHKKGNSSYILIAWLLFSLFALLFLLSPYQRGLFFHTDFFSIGMVIQALFLLSLVLMFPVLKEQVRQQWRILLVLFAIPLVYTLSFWYSYLPSTAAYEALQWFSYVLVFFLLLVWMATEKRVQEWLWLLAWGTLMWITGMVFLVHFELLEFQDALLDGRFSSVFQYPNTFAALLSIFVIVGLMNLTKRTSKSYTCLYAFSLFPFFLAFLLTQSRGALLVFVAAWVLGLFFLSWREQLLYVGHSVVLGLVGFWSYIKYGEWMQEDLIGQSVVLVLGLTVVLGLFLVIGQYLLVQHRLLSVQSKWNLFAPTLLTVTGALSLHLVGATLSDKLVQLLPEGLQGRMTRISLDEAYSRLLFFKDSLVVWKDHLFLGAGGGGWQALFESYKSLPYYSTQAHSFYMQTLVEVGLLGSIVVFGFLFYVVLKGIWFYFYQQEGNGVGEVNQDQRKLLLSSAIMAAVILLLHAAIDFNMSFGTYNLFLFLFLALIWNLVQDKPWLSKLFGSVLGRLQEKVTDQGKTIVTYSIIGILGLCSFFAAYTFYAYNQAEQVQVHLQKGGELPILLAHVEKAMADNPHDVRFRLMKLNVLGHVYQQTGDTAWLEQMKEEYELIVAKEPTMYQHYLHYAQFLGDIGEQEEAMELKLKALAVAPWQQSIYENIVASGIKYVQEMIEANQEEQASALVQKLDEVMQQYEARLVAQVKEAPEGFIPHDKIHRNYDHQLNMAVAYLYQEKYTAALEALRVYFPENWLEQEWYLNMFIEGEDQKEEQVRPFSLHTLREDLQKYLKEGYVVILAGEGASARHISQPVKDLLVGIGSDISNLGVYASYVGAIVDGKMVAELMDEENPVEITNKTHPELSKALGEEFSFYSAGHDLGNDSAIIWQGEDYAIQGSGLTIIVLDNNLNVVERKKYSTHYSDYKIIVQEEEK